MEVLAKFIWKTKKAISYKKFLLYCITQHHNQEQHNVHVIFQCFGDFWSHSESVIFHFGLRILILHTPIQK
jgi:hypothetical protein